MLNPNERDILREVGNIGAGHAATALSTLLGQPIEIEVPSAELEDFTTIIERSGGRKRIPLVHCYVFLAIFKQRYFF